jgi:phosphatidylserine/phosphatidylglycerophosphate/cardiolipin synthase-like enzyme
MRFRSIKTGGYRVFAVTGTNTVSFAIDFSEADPNGLLGFAVERIDPKEDERYYLYGFKVFRSVVQQPGEGAVVTTFDQPVQSFVWDDFTAKDGRTYTYLFHPLKGKPKKLDRSAPPIAITVRTEPLFSKDTHDVFFNRGVASSQAYARRFENKRPADLKPEKRQLEALEWLSRKLDDAILKFIDNARDGDALLCCFYEFRYLPVAKALRAALDRGVDVRLIVDAKVNETTDKDGTVHESFPREANLRTLAEAGIPSDNVVLREAKPNAIAHNKFMVLLKGQARVPSEVWTGSTNISEGGIHGQTNVGHWVRNTEVAEHYQNYWDLLRRDPGPARNDPDVRRKNKELRESIERLLATPTAVDQVSSGITPVFSPRSGDVVLNFYAHMVDTAKDLSCITLAFGISDVFKQLLKDNDADSHLAFFLLEKEDKPNPRSDKEFVKLGARNNVYEAWGSFLHDALYQWTKETNAGALQLNQHVSYVHSKFLLMDPLSLDPIVVTGSANFSQASTNDNDENLLVIRGNQRVADIYFTEFNRLFNHYYFRSVQEATHRLDREGEQAEDQGTLFLVEDDSWLEKYGPRSLKRKRVEALTHMQGFAEEPT